MTRRRFAAAAAVPRPVARPARSLLALAIVAGLIGCGQSADVDWTSVRMGGWPSDVSVARGTVWVADSYEDEVLVVDPESLDVLDTVEVEDGPIGIHASGDSVWVSHGTGWLVEIDAKERKVRRRIHEKRASFTDVVVGDETLWASDVMRGLFAVAEGEDDGEWIKLDDGAVRVIFAEGFVWATGFENTVTRVDPRSRKTKSYKVGSGPIGLTYDGERVWTANGDDGTVSTLGGEVRRVGRGPIDLVVAGDVMWVANQDDATLSRIAGEEVSTIDLAATPRGLATDGHVVWVAAVNPRTLVRVDP